MILAFLLGLLIIMADQKEKNHSIESAAPNVLYQPSSTIKGDCNCDGKISREEVELLLQVIGEELPFSSFNKKETPDIKGSWKQYNNAFSSYIKELQTASLDVSKKKENMWHYLEIYYIYNH